MLQTVQPLGPGILVDSGVAASQPVEVVGVGGGVRQRIAVVEGQQVTQHHRGGPAVGDEVVVAEDQPCPVVRQQHQFGGDQRATGEVLDVHRTRRHDVQTDLGGGECVLRRQRGEVHGAPGQVDGAGNDLDRFVQRGGVEAGTQQIVTVEDLHQGGVQTPGVDPAVQVDSGGEDVAVATVGGVVQQSLLQRGDRQDIGQWTVAGLPDVDRRLVGAVGQVCGARTSVGGPGQHREVGERCGECGVEVVGGGVGECVGKRAVQDGVAGRRVEEQDTRPGGGHEGVGRGDTGDSQHRGVGVRRGAGSPVDQVFLGVQQCAPGNVLSCVPGTAGGLVESWHGDDLPAGG